MGKVNSTTKSLQGKNTQSKNEQQSKNTSTPVWDSIFEEYSQKEQSSGAKDKKTSTPVWDSIYKEYSKSGGGTGGTATPKSVLLPSVVENTSGRAASLMQAVTSDPNKETPSGFYSRQGAGQKSQWALENMQKIEYDLVPVKAVLDAAGSILEEETTNLNSAWGAVEAARTAFEANPTQENVKAYNEMVTSYNSFYDRYNNAYSEYESAYAAYKTQEDKYREAAALYETERSRVRDPQTVQQEMETVQGALSELYKGQRLTQFNDWAGAIAASMMAGVTGTPVQTQMGSNTGSDPRIQELEQRLKDLEEEYTWSNDILNRETDQKWQSKYAGKSYEQLTSAMAKLPADSEERQWLQQYAPNVMTAADYDKQVPLLESEIEKLKVDRAVFTDATQRYQTFVQNGGDPNADFVQNEEWMIAYRQMVKQYGDLSKLEAELEDKQATKWAFENSRKYNYLQGNADYEEKSTEISENPTAKFGLQIGNKFIGAGDPVYDYINDIGGQRTQGKQTGGNAAMRKYDHMSEEEVANYNYLYNTEGKEAAGEYLKYLEADLDKRNQEELVKQYQQLAQENPAAASALSVPANLLGGLGYLDIAGQRAVKGIKEAITGEYSGPINYNRSKKNSG